MSLSRIALWIVCLGFPVGLGATNYYFHPEVGKDTNEGIRPSGPFRQLAIIEGLDLKPGDAIFLAAGYTFEGMIRLAGRRGTQEEPILISSYQWGNSVDDPKATIDAGTAAHGIFLVDCSYITIENLIIQAPAGRGDPAEKMKCGVLVTTSHPGLYENIYLKNLFIRDIFIEGEGFERGKDEIRTANGTQRYGWGIRFINQTEGAHFKSIHVIGCRVENVAHTGIKFTSHTGSIFDLKVFRNSVRRTGGPGIQMSGVQFGHIANNYINGSGSADDPRKWGRGSGLWTWGCSDILIEHNTFLNANGPGDSAGCHIDFNCSRVVVQYNFSANNAGGFCEILGNNYHCAYRYNVSVNDGHRVKGEKGAFQEGKTFWLSGYSGNKTPRKGPFNSYFYNNTIYVSKEIISKIAVDRVAKGILIANNIFYLEGQTELVQGDQYRPETAGDWLVEDVFFKNNLFLRPSAWPQECPLQDLEPLIGDPHFLNKGGLSVYDYIPADRGLIKDRGILIPAIPNDPAGLAIGLHPPVDILGNFIKGRPDLGAIEME